MISTGRIFLDRADAGRALGRALDAWRGRGDVIVLGLARGGVAVAFEVAESLGAPLDVFIVRKLGVPGQPELAMGAIASGGVRVLNPEVVRGLRISEADIDRVARDEEQELARRWRAYRGGLAPLAVTGKNVIVVDDGIATGSTMRAGVQALRKLGPARVIVAVPHAPPDAIDALSGDADEFVCLETPDPYFAVGCWYHDFRQVEDAEVRELLERAAMKQKSAGTAAPPPGGS